jgi:hypothetical protein
VPEVRLARYGVSLAWELCPYRAGGFFLCPLRRHGDPAPSPWIERPCRAFVRRLHWGRPTPYDRGGRVLARAGTCASSICGPAAPACRNFRTHAESKALQTGPTLPPAISLTPSPTTVLMMWPTVRGMLPTVPLNERRISPADAAAPTLPMRAPGCLNNTSANFRARPLRTTTQGTDAMRVKTDLPARWVVRQVAW